jgi:hypothetical protein
MDQGRTRALDRAAARVRIVGGRVCRLGRCVVLATLLAAVLLGVAITATLEGGSGKATRITLTMPCSQVDAASVGHRAYGLDQVISAGCAATAHR